MEQGQESAVATENQRVLLAEHERRTWDALVEMLARLPATLDPAALRETLEPA